MKKDPNHWERYREIGFRIAYCRKYQKMTQEELAEKLNVSRQHIGAIEAPNVNRKNCRPWNQNSKGGCFYVISYFVKSLMNTCLKDRLRCPGLARYHPFLDGTLSLRCATSRYLMSLKYET